MDAFPDATAWGIVVLQLVFVALACCFIVSGTDEFFVDMICIYRKLRHRFIVEKRYTLLSDVQLFAKAEQNIAIMIPCWDESAVIGRMVSNTVNVLAYSHYVIFIGTYPNDPKTRREVALLREKYHNIERIVCPKDGPTSKADCLNWIYEGIKLYEKEHGVNFDIIAMNDSEDIMHPWVLKLYNYLIPRVDMVQLPVFPMERPWYMFTAGHYLDEFAENHTRDMMVREHIGGAIPSAGVGTAFSHSILNKLAATQNNQVFTLGSLTEDYDLGLRLYDMGAKQIFVRNAPVWISGDTVQEKSVPLWLQRNYIGIREYFPDTFRAAVRQKSRWVAGIALQGWARIGWKGSAGQLFMLMRDRKGIITNFINLMANMMLVILSLYLLQPYLFPDAYRLPPLVEKGSVIWWIVCINFFFFFWRITLRFAFVNGVYGPWQAALSIPRLFWANVINFFATMRALRLFLAYCITGKSIAWDKTDHVFPNEQELQAYRNRLGDMLLERRFVSVGELDNALEEQKRTGEPLGEILLRTGSLKENELLQVLSIQFKISTEEIDPYAVPLECIRLLPKNIAVRYRIFPLALQADGTLVIGVEKLPSPQELRAVQQLIERPLQCRLVTRGDLSFALQRGYARLEKDVDASALIGHKLVAAHTIDRSLLLQALRRQRQRHKNLGQLLVDEGVVSRQDMDKTFMAFCDSGMKTPLGSFLVESGAITQEQLDAALKTQKSLSPPVSEVLAEIGVVAQKPSTP